MPDETEKSDKPTDETAKSAAPKVEAKADAKADDAKVEAKPTAAAPVDAKSVEAKDTTASTKEDAEASDDDDGDDAEGEGDDAFRPEAIAKRIEKIGGETDVERQAREEEAKLAERRRQQKKKGKKGLEAAASKKLAKIGDRPVKRAATAVPADADPLLERTAKISDWMRDNQRTVGIGVAAIVLGAVGFGGYTWWQKKREGDASVILAQAVADEHGQIGDPSKVKDDPDKPKDPRPMFPTVEARRESALAKYKDVETRFAGTGAAMLARLGDASLLLDKHDTDGAIAAFNDVKASPLAQADAEVRGRALEGLGFAYELKASLKPEEREKNLDLAMKAFKELEQNDVKGFKELATYHQARILEAKGDRQAATDLLKTLQGKLREQKQKGDDLYPYLDTAVDDRLASLDPSTIQRKPRGGGGFPGMGGMPGLEGMMGPDGRLNITPEQLQEMLKQQGQGIPGGGAPPAPPVKK